MFLKYVCFLLVTFFSLGLFAQDLSISTLESLEDEELLTLFNEVEKDSIKAEKVARVYLNRARKQKDTIKMARGYDRLARIFHPQKNLQFTDSIIFLTKDMNHITYPGLAYMLKSYDYRMLSNFIDSYKSNVIAYNYAIKNDNLAHQIFILSQLINYHSMWGSKSKALELLDKNKQLLDRKDYLLKLKQTNRNGLGDNIDNIVFMNLMEYLASKLHIYTHLKKEDSIAFYLKKIDIALEKYKNKDTYRESFSKFRIISEVEIDFFDKKYSKVIKKVDADLIKSLSMHGLKNIFYYRGMAHYALNDKEKGIKFLLKTDSIFDADKNAFLPYFKPTYQILYQYYSKQGDTQKKLYFLNKLIQADSIIQNNYKFFEPSLVNTFETKLLLDEKESLIQSLQLQSLKKTKWVWFFLISFSLLVFSLLVYIKKQSTYKKRYLALTTGKLQENTTHDASIKKSKLAKEIIIKILEGLEVFENKKEYLFSNITLTSLAKSLGTNKSYLSHTINLQKGKRFSDYINNLRVQHAFILLKGFPKYRKYTIKAIAQECGFKSGESFSKSFYKNYGIYPSYYIHQLEQSKKKTA